MIASAVNGKRGVILPVIGNADILPALCRGLAGHGFVPIVVAKQGKEQGALSSALAEECVAVPYMGKNDRTSMQRAGIDFVCAQSEVYSCLIITNGSIYERVEDICVLADAYEREKGMVIGVKEGKNGVLTRLLSLVLTFGSGIRQPNPAQFLWCFGKEAAEVVQSCKAKGNTFPLQAVMQAKAQGISVFCASLQESAGENGRMRFVAFLTHCFAVYGNSMPLKFLSSSVIAFLIDYSLSVTLKNIGMLYELAVALAWVVSSMCNFLLNYSFAFRSRSPFFITMGEYYSLAGIILLIKKFGFQELFVRGIGIPLTVASPVCEVITYPISYLIQKKLIFRRKIIQK